MLLLLLRLCLCNSCNCSCCSTRHEDELGGKRSPKRTVYLQEAAAEVINFSVVTDYLNHFHAVLR